MQQGNIFKKKYENTRQELTMNANQFVKKLGDLYSQEIAMKMQQDGLSEDYIKEYRNSYFFITLQNQRIFHDPLIDLVNNYDGSKVCIGMLNFDIKPYEDDNYYYFGNFEGDLLGIDKNLKTIQILEYGTDNHILYDCASNSENFLKAILMVAEISKRCELDSEFSNNDILICKMAEECGEIAGNREDYQDFYKMMLGV